MIAFNLACYASVAARMEEAKERLRHAIELDKEARKLALEDEDLKPLLGLDRRFEIVGRAFSSAGLFPLHKEVLNLVEVFETARLPRAIERFINQKAAVVGGPHISGWRCSQTTEGSLLCCPTHSL
jgi:hypothetical protein